MKEFKWVLMSNQFGNEMYVEDHDGFGIEVTDSIDKATVFDERDQPAAKIKFHNAMTGLVWQQKIIEE